MKKLLYAVILLLIISTLIGCSKGKESMDKTTQTPNTSPTNVSAEEPRKKLIYDFANEKISLEEFQKNLGEINKVAERANKCYERYFVKNIYYNQYFNFEMEVPLAWNVKLSSKYSAIKSFTSNKKIYSKISSTSSNNMGILHATTGDSFLNDTDLKIRAVKIEDNTEPDLAYLKKKREQALIEKDGFKNIGLGYEVSEIKDEPFEGLKSFNVVLTNGGEFSGYVKYGCLIRDDYIVTFQFNTDQKNYLDLDKSIFGSLETVK